MEHLESNILVFMDTHIYLIQLFTSNNNWKDISCKNVDAHSSNKKNTVSLIIWSFIDCISMQFFAFCKVGKNCLYFTTGRNYTSCLKLHSKLIEFINTYLQQWLIDQPDKFCRVDDQNLWRINKKKPHDLRTITTKNAACVQIMI